jgi:hypothetical protein
MERCYNSYLIDDLDMDSQNRIIELLEKYKNKSIT